MTRATHVTIPAVMTLCSIFLAGCSSNPSGVNTQEPPSRTTSAATTSSSPALISVPSSTGLVSSPPASSSPTTPTAASSPPSSSPARTSSTPSSKTTTPADPEAADRKAIEAVWTKYWVTVKGLMKIPVRDRLTVMRTVAAPALATAVVSRTATEEAAGQAEYGSIVHRPFWSTSVGGKSTAVMNDCMNDYNAGVLDVKTKKPLRAGVYRDNTRGTFVKGSDGLWRVAKAEYLVNVPC